MEVKNGGAIPPLPNPSWHCAQLIKHMNHFNFRHNNKTYQYNNSRLLKVERTEEASTIPTPNIPEVLKNVKNYTIIVFVDIIDRPVFI
jgi:hypothetical protein